MPASPAPRTPATSPSTEPTFYGSFAANMALLGLDAPRSLFDTVEKATLHIGSIAVAVKQYGRQPITMREVVQLVPTLGRATVLAGAVVRLSAVSGAFYVGAAIGSLVVAADQTPSVRNLLATAHRARVQPAPWVLPTLTTVAAHLYAAELRNPARRQR
jgi:hypothetical protein